jgi:hypothetical protein
LSDQYDDDEREGESPTIRWLKKHDWNFEEDNHLVSTVSVNTMFLFLQYQPQEVESLSENIDIRELDDRWHGENVDRFRFNTQIEDYLTTFTFPDNIIVVRCIQDYRQCNQGVNYSNQIIWNSSFTWRQINQHLEDCMYNVDFRYEMIDIGVRNFGGERVISSPMEEKEVPNSLRVAVNELPVVMFCKESEKDDGVMCPMCQETFSTEQHAKQFPCKHLYHSKCTLKWFRHRNSCPMCRSEQKDFVSPVGILTVHSGEKTGCAIVTDAIATPIVQTSTYTFKNTVELIAFQEGRHISYEYGRYGNPTTQVVEEKNQYVFLHNVLGGVLCPNATYLNLRA